MLPLNSKQHAILADARAAGLCDGFTVPVNAPGELSGSVSFAVQPGREIDLRVLPALHYAAIFAYEAARRIARAQSGLNHAPPNLTSRQFDCIVLVARGKSNWEAAKILGLSEETVRQHIHTAMKKFEVSSRTQLVVKTLFNCQLTFRDVLH